jgi:hypothetical protein
MVENLKLTTMYRSRRDRQIRYQVGLSIQIKLLPPSRIENVQQSRSGKVLNVDTFILQIWRLPTKAGEEDGDHSTRPLHLHVLRQKHC